MRSSSITVNAVEAGTKAYVGAIGGGNLGTLDNVVRVVLEAAEPWVVSGWNSQAARWLRVQATKARNDGREEAADALDAAADHFAALAAGEDQP